MRRKAIIFGIKGTKLTAEERFLIKTEKPWGIILFSRNIKNLFQLKFLINDIRKIIKDKNYPILIDQEGGRVSRLNQIIDLNLFSQGYFGKLYKHDKKVFIHHYKIYINKVSDILKKVGININTVPVMDVRRKNSHNVIGNRSFSTDPTIVSKIGNLCINLYKKNKIATVIKHIPGHGLAKVDSHKFTPIINNKAKYLFKNDFAPFKNKKTFFAMTAHIIYKNIDPLNTATHSPKIIKLIRNKIGFKNIIISDDISMKALKNSIKINTLKAFAAGCNLILHCNANYAEMRAVAENSPLVNNFIIKKTSQFYRFLS